MPATEQDTDTANERFQTLKPTIDEMHRLICTAPGTPHARFILACYVASAFHGMAAALLQEAEPAMKDYPISTLHDAISKRISDGYRQKEMN